MAGALTWTMGLADKMSGPARAMGAALEAMTGKLRDAGHASEALQRKQEATLRASVGRDAIAGLQKRNKGQEDAARGDFMANMKHYDTVRDDGAAIRARETATALGRQREAAAAAAKEMDKLRAAARAAAAQPYTPPRATMGKTGVNQAGGIFGKTEGPGAVGRMVQALSATGPTGARASASLLRVADSASRLGSAASKTLAPLSGIGRTALAGLGSVVAMAAKAAAAIALVGVGLAAAGARYVVQMQSFKQSTMFAFSSLLGGQAAANGAWERVKATAEMTGMSLTDAGSAFNSLLAQGFDLSSVDDLVKRMGDLKALNPATNIEGIARAISQIKTAGTLQGDELNQLAEAGLSKKLVYEEMAKSMGKTVEQVKKLQSAGKISSEVALDAVNKAMRRAAGGKDPGKLAAEAASTTIAGGFGRLVARIQTFASGLKIDFAPVARLFDRIGNVLKGDAGIRFGKSIEGAFAEIGVLIDGITEKDIAAGFDIASATIESAAATVKDFAGAIKTIDGWMTSINAKTGAWGTIFQGVAIAIGMAVQSFRLILNPLGVIRDLVMMVATTIHEWTSGILAAGDASSSFMGGGLGMSGNALGAPAGGSGESPMATAIRRAMGDGGTGAPAAAGGIGAAPEAGPKSVTNNITVTANGLTFAQFEQKVGEIVEQKLAAQADA